MSNEIPVIAIDGPTGSGKSTISRALAKMLNWHFLDSGALYRLVALRAMQEDANLEDPRVLAKLASRLDVEFSTASEAEVVCLDGEDVTALLRMEECGSVASKIAPMSMVRAVLLEQQRGFVVPPGLVADGRDMGTVVFPAAILKVFLTASAKDRAKRRYNQLKEKGIDVSLRDLSREIARRDERDTSRQIAPLKPAGDARVLDSTQLNPEEVVERIHGWLEELDFRVGMN
ncbi:MAG: (d)CMP kinase [Pseudomonadota bacterium]|jgi:cytidylate kinase|nr:(d)CMP kinase [Pseudomonadota bacterium]